MNKSLFPTIAFTLSLAACSSNASDSTPTPTMMDAAADTTTDAGALDAAPELDAQAPTTCTAAREQLMGPIDKVSTGNVATLSNKDGVRTLYVDASAGGTQAQGSNPRVYLNLETGARVDVTDVAALGGTAALSWDLAIKRPILFTNSGDAGPGQGNALFLSGKSFDSVSAADARTLSNEIEQFFGKDCAPKVDRTNAMLTSFSGWYDYDTSTSRVTPAAGAWIVRGATGKLYKLAVLSYYANPDGTEGPAGGRYTLKVKALQ